MKDWIINIGLGVIGVLTPVFPLFVTIFILIGTDFIFGIYRAWKKKELITSRKMSNTISKILLYNLMVLSLFLLETYVLTGIPLSKLGAAVIGLVELKSIDEHFQLLFGFSIYEKLKSKFDRNEKSFTKDFETPCDKEQLNG